jgi:hypothetical protein
MFKFTRNYIKIHFGQIKRNRKGLSENLPGDMAAGTKYTQLFCE